ncbi:hypothetical protein [Burkholderia sp. F1]|uniref:hypothetical protein n=1 Tax=Burkholderia sp. F1 TaxID=3366817 RepID=UPI003D760A26
MATYFAQSANQNRDAVHVTLDMGIATIRFYEDPCHRNHRDDHHPIDTLSAAIRSIFSRRGNLELKA